MSDDNIRPGSFVTARGDIPAMGKWPGIPTGSRGHVVRLLHMKVEGEPFEDGRDGQIIAHVRWEGFPDSVCPIDPDLLCVLPATPFGAPLEETARVAAEPDITIGAKHPLWAAWDDDDWNGATAASWYNQYVKPGVRIVLTPPLYASYDLVCRIVESLERGKAIVAVCR